MPYKFVQEHIWDKYLKKDRLPHIWCPGCGLGTALSAFLMGIELAKIDLDKLVVVSGIGCAGRAAGYLNVDTFHTTHGRPIPFAIGLKLARPDLHVVVFSGDGDLATIGGNHLIHAARRNHDILVICWCNDSRKCDYYYNTIRKFRESFRFTLFSNSCWGCLCCSMDIPSCETTCQKYC